MKAELFQVQVFRNGNWVPVSSKYFSVLWSAKEMMVQAQKAYGPGVELRVQGCSDGQSGLT